MNKTIPILEKLASTVSIILFLSIAGYIDHYALIKRVEIGESIGKTGKCLQHGVELS
jgi:hypothetical protein